MCSELGRAYQAAEFGLSPHRSPFSARHVNDRLLSADPVELRNRLGWSLDKPIWLWLPPIGTPFVVVFVRRCSQSPSRLPFTAESRARLDGLLAERGMAAAYRSNRGINLEPCEDWVPGPIMSDVGSHSDRLA